jgi:plastocyanin
VLPVPLHLTSGKPPGTPQQSSSTPQPSATTPQPSPTTPQPSPTTPQPSPTTPQPSPTTSQPSPTTSQPSPTTPSATKPARHPLRPRHGLPPAASSGRHRRWRLAFPRSHERAKAHSARDPGDTISDYQFSPGTLTVHVGDTVTWTNAGPSEHSATANDHSFDTGLLKKGSSASHTFAQAETITYFCSIHPFMHGTIVVLAAAVSTPTTAAGTPATAVTSPTGTTSSPTASTSTASGPTLPVTGLDLGATALSGVALVGVGYGIRRRIRASIGQRR